MILSVAICAHISRQDMAEALQSQLDCPVSMDDGTLGSERNHDKALKLAAEKLSDWVILIEDDAQPIPEFYEQASAALAVAPQPIASLYFGYIGDDRALGPKLSSADPHWFVSDGLANTVCLAVRRDFLPALLEAAERYPDIPSDLRYERAAYSLSQNTFAYSYPSLVEHADVQTVHYTGAPHVERRAFRVGTRPEWIGNRSPVWLHEL